jgi:hypothetical protein
VILGCDVPKLLYSGQTLQDLIENEAKFPQQYEKVDIPQINPLEPQEWPCTRRAKCPLTANIIKFQNICGNCGHEYGANHYQHIKY